MYCIKCGANLNTGIKFCPECGNMVSSGNNPTPSPQPIPKPAPEQKPIPECQDPEEERFYFLNRSTSKGLEAYLAKYPDGFYAIEAKMSMSSVKCREESAKRKRKKVFKTIALVIAVPFVLCSTPFGSGGGFRLGRLIEWYKREE